MIRDETEYKDAVNRLADERIRFEEHRTRLRETGLSEEEIKRVIDPMESFHFELGEEVESYERLKRGEFDELENLRGFGQLLISLRSASRCTNCRCPGTNATSTTASRSSGP
jgi:hypothetical protein